MFVVIYLLFFVVTVCFASCQHLRYFDNDLPNSLLCVLQGPLSDAANTASGIVGDILRIAKSLGAKDKGPAVL